MRCQSVRHVSGTHTSTIACMAFTAARSQKGGTYSSAKQLFPCGDFHGFGCVSDACWKSCCTSLKMTSSLGNMFIRRLTAGMKIDEARSIVPIHAASCLVRLVTSTCQLQPPDPKAFRSFRSVGTCSQLGQLVAAVRARPDIIRQSQIRVRSKSGQSVSHRDLNLVAATTRVTLAGRRSKADCNHGK